VVRASSGLRVWLRGQRPTVADSGPSSSRDVVVGFAAEGGKRYVVLPYTTTTTKLGQGHA
jgi:hypothetical protein